MTNVYDGNRFRLVDTSQTVHMIRLEKIDCPELTQRYGADAKRALEERIEGRRVRVDHSFFDMHGRILGDVYFEERWINLELVQAGLAWCVLEEEVPPPLQAAADAARAERTGLWRESNPIPPWHWRRGARVYREGMETDPGGGRFPRHRSSNERELIGN